MALTSTQLTSLFTSIYTSTNDSAVTVFYLCNASSSPVFVTVCLVPRSETANDQTNVIYYNIPIASHDTYVVETEKIILEHGDSIQAKIHSGYVSGMTRVIATVSSIAI